MARWNVGEHINRGYNSNQIKIQWFVNNAMRGTPSSVPVQCFLGQPIVLGLRCGWGILDQQFYPE
ncbi:hypothetical protein VINI7043_03863 [Vibrio nigripulchritudo ATCC 27043]|nr:hypothetical protein VINI7043_03863 [Vibrio nigripulchritudo ATCC 27043]